MNYIYLFTLIILGDIKISEVFRVNVKQIPLRIKTEVQINKKGSG